ncbi:uncharacterized protein LOC136093752 [Hydra vulgaris]|uniref:uncharacterized protein LOC136093752 n=1 Tax=Hydra vulgaris TaxID=6087 RepID=UPI0032E9FD71
MNINIDYVVPNTNENFSDSDDEVEIERIGSTIFTSLTIENMEQKPSCIKTDNQKMNTSLFSCRCDNCKSTFTRRSDLKRHKIKFHGVSNVSQSRNSLCIQCGHRFHKIKDLRKHLNGSHNIEFRIELLNFDKNANKFLMLYEYIALFCLYFYLKDFDSWKYQLEEENGSSYIKTQGDVVGKEGSKTKFWQCNRCGMYKSSRTGKRRIKSSGTCKIEKNCTSTIKEVTNKDGKIKVEVYYTHYGHSQDLHHTWITKRQEIASKLLQEVTRGKNLDDIR